MEIKLKEVVKIFDSKTIIHKTNLTIRNGCFTTLLGPSGCGKTTLLRMISGLETPDEGEIWFDDTCVFSKEKKINVPPEKRKLGFVFQDFALWPHMTVFENVAYGLRARKDTERLNERVEDALKAVHLEHCADRYPHQLSGGQQQRIAFARAFVMRPACILFDEPLSALDAILREEMRTEIRKLVEHMGITAVFVTHDQSEAMSLSDEIVVLNEGKIAQRDVPEAIYHHPASPFVARFIGRSNWLGDDAMFRPEAADLAKPEEEVCQYKMKVDSVQFMGNTYELLLKKENLEWIIPSRYKPEKDEEITVYIRKNEILQFQGGNVK